MLKFQIQKIFLLMILGLLSGCATGNLPDYIKAGHPYVRKIAGNYDRIIKVVKTVLSKEGWTVKTQLNPSVYERRSGGEDQSNDVLFVTQSKRDSKILYSTYAHLNVFVHALADGAEIEIRYEILSPATTSLRNDKLANRILDKIEQELENK